MPSALRVVRSAALLLGLLACVERTPAALAGEEVCGTAGSPTCEAGKWCDPRPGGCSLANPSGVCRSTPDVCTDQYQPVCGCDGKTYSNDCHRRAMQVPKDHDGACQGGGGPDE